MRDNFEQALKRVLVHEGGFSNHPADPGGATMRGVTQRVYDGYRVNAGRQKQSVRHITQAELVIIYRELYADKIRFDDLPPGIDICVFDAAVNSGPAQASKWLQRALGGLVVDGVIGPATVLAANSASNKPKIVADICAQRMKFLRALATWSAFGKGWSARVRDIESASYSMAAGFAVTHAPTTGNTSRERGRMEDARSRASTAGADAAIGGGVATETIAGTVQQAQDQLAPLAGSNETVGVIVAVLALVGVVAIAGGLGWRWWQKRRAKEHAQALDLPAQVAT